MEVGFIGLGAMGAHMAARLVKAGHVVRVWNRTRPPVDRLVALGARAAPTARETLDTDLVFSVLSGDAAVKKVFDGARLLEDKTAAKTVHVNMSTVSVAYAEDLAKRHAQRKIGYVAAPVFGRPQAAKSGSLTIVAAGADAAVDRALPLLELLGTVHRLGEIAQHANVVKIAGSFMIGCAIEAMAESAALVENHGVRASEMFNILLNTMFAAPVYKAYGALVAEPQSTVVPAGLAIHENDLELALAASSQVTAPLPLANVLRDNLLDARAHGDADRDWAIALANVARRRAGIV